MGLHGLQQAYFYLSFTFFILAIWKKVTLGQVFSESFCSAANSHCTDSSGAWPETV
jgi:hypothetical protein